MLTSRGPWSICHDGATSQNGHQLLNVLAQNAFGEQVHLDLVNAGWQKKDATMLADLLKKQVLRCGQVSCIITDGAKNCRKALSLLAAVGTQDVGFVF